MWYHGNAVQVFHLRICYLQLEIKLFRNCQLWFADTYGGSVFDPGVTQTRNFVSFSPVTPTLLFISFECGCNFMTNSEIDHKVLETQPRDTVSTYAMFANNILICSDFKFQYQLRSYQESQSFETWVRNLKRKKIYLF